MKISARSVLMAGVATVTASAVVIAPSVQPPPPPRPTIQLAASSPTLRFSNSKCLYISSIRLTLSLDAARTRSDRQAWCPAPGSDSVRHRTESIADRSTASTSPWSPGWTTGSRSPRGGSAGFRMVGWLTGQIMASATTSANASSPAASSTSPIGFDGNVGVVENLVDFGIDVGRRIRLVGNRRSGIFSALPPTSRCRRGRRGMVRSQHSTTLDGPDGGAGGWSRECRQLGARLARPRSQQPPQRRRKRRRGFQGRRNR